VGRRDQEKDQCVSARASVHYGIFLIIVRGGLSSNEE
jgi:hypothetical protein